jgi:hypothetical protein
MRDPLDDCYVRENCQNDDDVIEQERNEETDDE